MKWFRGAADVPKGRRKLVGLGRSLLAVTLICLGSELLIGHTPAACHAPLSSIAMAACGTVAALFSAFAGFNAAEHKHSRGNDDAG